MDYILIFIAAFTISSIICFVIYSIIVKFPLEFKFEERPLLFLVYLKSFWLSLKRKQTSKIQHLFKENGSKIFRDSRITVIARDCRIDRWALQSYATLCGYPDECQYLPPCYLHTYFVTLITVLITSDEFKLNPLGLMHVKQSFSQHTTLEHLMKEPFDVECKLVQYRSVELGIEMDFVMRVYDRREMCIWEGTNTILSRNTDSVKRRIDYTPCSDNEEEDHTRNHERLSLDLPVNLGRRFAWASGDWNLQHLWRWTSRLVDFSQPSVHGVWSLARCLAHLQSSGLFALTPPFYVSARFKKPIFLPGSSVCTFMRQTDKDLLCFKVEDGITSAPQLTAHVRRK